MHPLPLFLSLLPLALSSPTPTPECTLPTPGSNCAGYPHADIIVQFPKTNNGTTDAAQRKMFRDVVGASGGRVGGELGGFGFTAFVPVEVVRLMKAYGDVVGVRVGENGCAGVPWCGEAPC